MVWAHFRCTLPLNTTSTTKPFMEATQKSVCKVLLRPIAKKQKATWKPAFPSQEWCHFAATETYSRGIEILPPIIHRVNYIGKYCNGLSPVKQLTYTTSFSITNLSALPSVKTNAYLVLPVSALALPLVELAAAAQEESPDCLCFPSM